MPDEGEHIAAAGGEKQECDPKSCGLPQQEVQLPARLRVQPLEGFIQDQQSGAFQQGPGDEQLAKLAVGEVLEPALQQVLPEPQARQDLPGGDRQDRTGRRSALRFQALVTPLQVVAGAGHQLALVAEGNLAHVSPRELFRGASPRQRVRELPLDGQGLPEQGRRQGALAGAAGAQHRPVLAPPNSPVQAFQDRPLAAAHRDAAHLHQELRGVGFMRRPPRPRHRRL